MVSFLVVRQVVADGSSNAAADEIGGSSFRAALATVATLAGDACALVAAITPNSPATTQAASLHAVRAVQRLLFRCRSVCIASRPSSWLPLNESFLAPVRPDHEPKV